MIYNIKNQKTRIESRLDVSTYLDRLKYALDKGTATINFQKDRNVDYGRKKEDTNAYTINELFPDEDIVTVKDLRFPKRSDMRVFGRLYDKHEIYIKIRVELLKGSLSGVENYVFIMSFHHSTIPFSEIYFPYKEAS